MEQKMPPGDEEMLFHYTTSEGIRGIVENGELWATNVRHLNDLQEVRLVFEAAASVLQQDYLQRRPDLKYSIEYAIDVLNNETGAMPYYVASFSRMNNALSQWRGYGGGDQAYVLGLVREDLARHAGTLGWRLVQVQYGVPAARRAVAEVIERALQRIDVGEFERSGDRDRVQHAVRLGLMGIAAEHKYDAFEEEKEWRLVSPRLQAFTNDKIHFRSNRKGLVPYVKFPLKKSMFPVNRWPTYEEAYVEQLDLGYVAAGPGGTDDTMHALFELLNANNAHSRRGVTRSFIPFSA